MFAMIALNTGARLVEILALQNADADLANRRLHIFELKELRDNKIYKRTKGGSDRWLGLNDELFDLFTARRREGNAKPKDYLVHLGGESLQAKQINRMHERTCKRAGLRKIRVHDLRHTFASHYVMNGGTLHDLQALLGHSSPMMTERYAHLAPGYLEKKASIVRISKGAPNVSVIRLA